MSNLRKLFESGNTLREKQRAVLAFLTERLQIADLYFIDAACRMRSAVDEEFKANVFDISKLTSEELYTTSTLSDVKEDCPLLYEALGGREIESMMIVRVGNESAPDGWLLCGAQRRFRIWQENERAIMFFLSSLLSGRPYFKREQN